MPRGYSTLAGSRHPHPKPHRKLGATDPGEELTVTLLLRRRRGAGRALKVLADFCKSAGTLHTPPSRTGFANTGGADPKDLKTVADFARAQGLTVLSSHKARRAVLVRGSVAQVNKSFALKLHNYRFAGGDYRSHDGPVSVPRRLAGIIVAVVGLTNRKVPAQHFTARRATVSADPPNTQSVTPQQIASLYQFPPGDGAGQTIGLYEMDAGGAAGYSLQDIQDSIQAFGGDLKLPTLIDVAIDGVGNSGVSDGETGLDITVAGAIAQGATIAVYFTGGTVQAIIHALQRMIHPDAGDPVPGIISISYGWGPDAPAAAAFSASEYTQLDALFQDAANLAITVLVSSGDSGAFIENKTKAQVSYPASEPWVTACGGTTVGNIQGSSFEEYAWNDLSDGGAHSPGATGGGISDRFAVPAFQQNAALPKNIVSSKTGRGVPDVAGNASENSGYIQYIQGQRGPVGGTSAVAPLYAGLIARINANLSRSVGFINPQIYAAAGGAFRDIAGPAGPLNNSYGRVVGYPVTAGWDGCTGLGSVKGMALQTSLQNAAQSAASRARAAAPAPGAPWPKKVFKSGTFRGVDVHDPFAVAALQESTVVVDIAPVWPPGLAPTPAKLGSYRPGAVIDGPLNAKVDVLIVLYTDQETQALLEVFSGNNAWDPARQKQWCGYAHNFAKFKSMIGNIGDDKALRQGLFGYLSAVKIGAKTVALYKTELHPKQNGAQLPFVPVLQQLITELAPSLVISTGTAGAIGATLNCGDVVITNAARFHCEHQYPNDPQINVLSQDHAELTNAASVNPQYVDYAVAHLTPLSLAGLAQCHSELTDESGYGFVRPNQSPPNIYVAGSTNVPGAQSMAVVSADYLTVDDSHDLEGLQGLGTMNDTDDAFLFFAISGLAAPKPAWLSIRNASEPQIVASIPAGTPTAAVSNKLAGIAGRIYGIYQYCTTLNSAFACWAVIAGL
ncbi:MAG TPA: protease pro-enzyme activation domain-containing protein [Steroidobacteraceae bacterium]|jgi:kumamolisin|nr:protease pro-enzyme activation domain-containing protein [Steroidobacteraceae bacterium]